jgi:hypothetical protein
LENIKIKGSAADEFTKVETGYLPDFPERSFLSRLFPEHFSVYPIIGACGCGCITDEPL